MSASAGALRLEVPVSTPARPGRARVAATGSGRSPLVVVANRLPVQRTGTGWSASPGGLTSALHAALRSRDGVWVGWPGEVGRLATPAAVDGIGLAPVELTGEECDGYYLGFSNATLWPLYHDAVRSAAFHREWWHAYREVNRRFALAAAEACAPNGVVWVHDYHLQLVPRLLRDLRPDVRIGFFLHIPFPPPELFLQLPWRRELVAGILGADLVGFQVRGAAANFSRLARRLAGARGTVAELHVEDRVVRVGAFPISVDVAELERLAASPATRERAAAVRHELGDPELVLLGVDRLDYTKGIEQRVRALAELFADGSLDASRHVMVQIAVPTRDADPHYMDERRHLEQVVGELNGEFAAIGRPALHYLHHSLPIEELVATYLAADVMVVTPFRDGMNLVAKEYVACRTDLTGALVLSEFAGAALELRGAFLVNPHDLEGLKEGIRRAAGVDPRAAQARMRQMRQAVRRHDVYDWATAFLAELGSPVGALGAAGRHA